MPAKRRTAPKARRTTARPPKPRTVTPYLVVSDATEALGWYQRAFGAKEFSRIPGPDGKILHAGFTVGGSQVFLSDVFPQMDITPPTALGGTSVNLHIFHKDCDRIWKRAVAEGAKVTMPLEDQFWGDRYGKITDPFGHSWAISRKAKMTNAEVEARTAEAMKQFGGSGP